MRRPDPAPAAEALAPVASAPAPAAAAASDDDRCCLVVPAARGALETPEITAGLPVKGEETGRKPSVLTRSVSVQSTARAVPAMASYGANKEEKKHVCKTRARRGRRRCFSKCTPSHFLTRSSPPAKAKVLCFLFPAPAAATRERERDGERSIARERGASKVEPRVVRKKEVRSNRLETQREKVSFAVLLRQQVCVLCDGYTHTRVLRWFGGSASRASVCHGGCNDMHPPLPPEQ